MADALCGPSNALQNFQKHSTVDRTLQQDRLTNRQSPSQGFRSSSGPAVGLLDPEFDAFQAGHIQPPQPDFHLLPHAQPQFPQFAQAHRAPDWASDFQRLSISSPQPPPLLQHHPPPQVSNATASWHQDFMSQQQPSLQQAPIQQQHNAFGGMSGSGMAYMGSGYQQRLGFGAMNGQPMSEVASGKQRAQEAVPQYDEAAFEKAFAELDQTEVENPLQAYQEILNKQEQDNVAQQERARTQSMEMHDNFAQQGRVSVEELQKIRDDATEKVFKTAPESDPVLAQLREKRPSVYYTLKLRSELDLEIPAQSAWLEALERAERQGTITKDASEARWCVEALNAITTRELPADLQSRVESLIKATNERLMSQHPFARSLQRTYSEQQFRQDLEAAGYRTGTPLQEQREPEQKKEEQQQQPPRHDDDEMAETAGRLLERVADNTSEKFQNSQFLSLMRRLRDREVRVEGDKMVDIPATPQTTSTTSTLPASVPIPEIDPQILSHSAQDFGMPMDSSMEGDEEEYSQGQRSI
ncbi:hypothetical protein B0J11DRAFT_131419 [Dendryphion nanum]|uniref:Uncharacterized protein n=1 Tax=Dendryphion nanum TaxID=256645 RepID=A0A9P9D7U2_9PLEO|nr:hypothetical protein B0J11DRAFT_131419 [Dendryphion nanum]